MNAEVAEESWSLTNKEKGHYDYALLLEATEAHRVAMGVWPRPSLAEEDKAERYEIPQAYIGTGESQPQGGNPLKEGIQE